MEATAKDLRFHSKELLDAVKSGQEVVITYRGKPSAKLVPFLSEKKPAKSDHKAFGMWKDNEAVRDVDSFIEKIRRKRT
jgi:prevent-host-death family protein